MNVPSRVSLSKLNINRFRAAIFSFAVLPLIGLSGWVAPAAGRELTRPVLEAILVEDRFPDTVDYRIAAAREWRRVRIRRGGMPLDAAPNMPLRKGDLVRTGPNAAVAIRFPNGTQLYVRSNSRFRIGSVFAFVGELFVRVRGAFRVDTEFVTAGAEGTEWVMAISPDGDTRCTVLEGRVRVASRANAWRPLSIAANRKNVTRNWLYTETMLASPEEISEMRRWIGQIDRLMGDMPARAPEDDGRPPPFIIDRDPRGDRPTRPDPHDRNPRGDRPARPDPHDRDPRGDRPTRPDPHDRDPRGDRPTRPDADRRPDPSGDDPIR